eukprot:5555395-Amphidinium_carterae.1
MTAQDHDNGMYGYDFTVLPSTSRPCTSTRVVSYMADCLLQMATQEIHKSLQHVNKDGLVGEGPTQKSRIA